MMDNLLGKNRKAEGHANGHWISVSDLMAGLMMVFLFIAIVHMKNEREEKARISGISEAYRATQQALYTDLYEEFKNDLPLWDAEITEDKLSVRFNSPDVLFSFGSDEVKDRFKNILSNFFPRYLSVIKKYRDDVSEIRIEGHTSSYWNGAKSELEAYFLNMRLSQDRTRSVLIYCLSLPQIESERSWARNLITANGLSSSKVIVKSGHEDPIGSRRVEFRVRTNAEEKIQKIFEESR